MINAMSLVSLESILKDIDHSTGQLLNCLQDELKALNEKQYESLITIAQNKQQLVEQLEKLDIKRRQFDDSKNFSDYLLQQDTSGKLAAYWNLVRDKIKKCQQQNGVNGRLLQRYHRLSRDTMSLLCGKPLNNDATYGPNGLRLGQQSLLSDTQA